MRFTFVAAIAASSLLVAGLPARAENSDGLAWLLQGPTIGEDSYPPAEQSLRPGVQRQVTARMGKGMPLAGFYNDPSLALAGPATAPEGGEARPRRPRRF